ncbi:hypothetical protein T01_903 [Trichinella spiralis]|uniref:Uncharacterized protein n=1 Tax=Trichinella spiralis TaxID=6334 RepID=A0A0V1BAJ8_TRISP|nr:hypothetical protein T01_903 [Trichinella spiralis]
MNRSSVPKENRILPTDGVGNFLGERYSLIRLMLLHCAQMIITRSCHYSYRFSSLTQSTEPAQNEALLQ